jgi:murein DD-endopeptidase MepM/ murein hydrolase activator NlpD
MRLPASPTPLPERLSMRLVQDLHAALSRGLLWAGQFLAWIDGEHPAISAALHRLIRPLRRYPRQFAALVATVFLASTGGAFAVANLGPDPSRLPVITLTQEVQVPSLEQQAQSLEAHDLQLLRQDLTRSSDTPETLLRRLGVTDPEAAQIMRRQASVRDALSRSGRSVTADVLADGRLRSLTVRWLRKDTDEMFQRLVFRRDDTSAFVIEHETAALSANIRMAGGIIRSSLYASADEARLPDPVSRQLADIFSAQIDFHRSLQRGARYAVVYEVLEADGEPIRSGRVLSAEFINGDRTHAAVWFEAPGQKGAYYALDGNSLRRAFLASPVAYSRKTSGFGMRLHPIFQTMRAHQGIDYAAPTGTPAHSVGDGVVEFAGVQGGYGKTVIVRHSRNHTTLYAHLSSIHVRKGQSVQQGQVIGAVGSTGWSTGPHLHFEFRVNGIHVDPARIVQAHNSVPLPASARPLFAQAAQQARLKLAAATHMRDGFDDGIAQ